MYKEGVEQNRTELKKSESLVDALYINALAWFAIWHRGEFLEQFVHYKKDDVS